MKGFRQYKYDILCIHANPRETKSGRGGSFFSSSEGRKMLHSAAFWI